MLLKNIWATKKTVLLSIKSWLVNREPYIGLLRSFDNWLVFQSPVQPNQPFGALFSLLIWTFDIIFENTWDVFSVGWPLKTSRKGRKKSQSFGGCRFGSYFFDGNVGQKPGRPFPKHLANDGLGNGQNKNAMSSSTPQTKKRAKTAENQKKMPWVVFSSCLFLGFVYNQSLIYRS